MQRGIKDFPVEELLTELAKTPLPEGRAYTEKPHLTAYTEEDRLLWACNKWPLAHPESDQAAQGAYVGLCGDNIDVEADMDGLD